MTGYGFGKQRGGRTAPDPQGDAIDLSGIKRTPLPNDPEREAAAIERGAAMGFVDRGEREPQPQADAGPRRRRQSAPPQSSVYVKGPKDTIDWFVEYTNQRGHRSYWQTIAEFRAMVEGTADPRGEGT